MNSKRKRGEYVVQLSEDGFFTILDKIDYDHGYKIKRTPIFLKRWLPLESFEFHINIFVNDKYWHRYHTSVPTRLNTRQDLLLHLTIMNHFGLTATGKTQKELQNGRQTEKTR